MNEELNTALHDLQEAIENITLGSIEEAVIQVAGEELIANWNDHNEVKIDEAAPMQEWHRRWDWNKE